MGERDLEREIYKHVKMYTYKMSKKLYGADYKMKNGTFPVLLCEKERGREWATFLISF